VGTLTHHARTATRAKRDGRDASRFPRHSSVEYGHIGDTRLPVRLAYLEGFGVPNRQRVRRTCERTPLSVRISSVAASICARGKIIVSP